MKRWNIANIFFLGVSGARRDVELQPNAVNIITGASGTGKSTLIKAIDYCLGSSKCELPAHVRRRCVAVGVKWVANDLELVVGRIVPPVGQVSSTRMFTASGRSLKLPSGLDDFEGPTTVDAAKAFLERAFGIGDSPVESRPLENPRGRATVRQVTPYIFVTKEVIYSESVMLHGLEKMETAKDIIATMPYFLRVADEVTAAEERRLRQLQRALEIEEEKIRAHTTSYSALKQRALSLLLEAKRLGLASGATADTSEEQLVHRLREVSTLTLEQITYPNESELGSLHTTRRAVLSSLSAARRQLQAAKLAIRDASGFGDAVGRQYEKLELVEHLGLDDIKPVCPVCRSPSSHGVETAKALRAALSEIRGESAAVERAKPKLVDYDRELEARVAVLSTELRQVDDQIRTWMVQSEDTRRLADLGQVQVHLLGRISFFLETSNDHSQRPMVDLGVLRSEIAELEARVDREARDLRLGRAEAKISMFASQAFSELPTVAPCIGSELDFSARRVEIRVIEAETGAFLRMPDVGSDQNYLAVHVALAFSLQRYLETVKSPVPGLLVFDQISRPYFPTSGDEDEAEIDGEEGEDVQAMRKHIDFLFAETERRSGLQVLLIEHAYFADDPRYVAATRERWTRASRRALIPVDWPSRSDD